MLRSVKELTGYKILATDGEIGSVHDFYFDNQNWVMRYLVVDTATWLAGRRVLLSPAAINQPQWQEQVLPVSLTQAQVKNSPDIDTDKPVSRQQESELYTYYNWSPYWDADSLFPLGAVGLYPVVQPSSLPVSNPAGEEAELIAKVAQEEGDPHLYSIKEVIDYYIHARDGDIGHVEDFLIDDETWAIQYMIVNTGNWLPGKKVLVSPSWIKTMSWTEKTVYIDLLRETIEKSPAYDPAVPIDRQYETELYDHYDRPKYWGDGE
jgi:uncharacterized protein YrrD